MRIYKLVAISIIGCLIVKNTYAQPTWTFDPFGKEKKPEKFENRKLGSERTLEKKFTKPRHLIQNTVTHYNYFFNANNKLNAVIERAKLSQQDDFTKLLPFYSYSLENTSSEKSELDSVIYKATAGILLHDLRNDWIDNLYLLIGKSYYLKKDFDSAGMAFQFINYNLFPRKKKDDEYDKVVGSNLGTFNSAITIANKEDRNFLQKLVSLPPSRNDALIWMSRTFTEQEAYADASGLIHILNKDPNLPNRLQNDLAEVTAYWFYKQQIYDSAAVYLEKALSNADTKNDKARWEFLLAQLWEMNKQYDKASEYYLKASKHTVDPLMDIYAQLNRAKMVREDKPEEINNTIARLLHMARKGKFDGYQDILYFSAAQLSMQKPDTTTAIGYYFKSIKYSNNNASYRNKSFLQLADIAYKRKDYKSAYAYYDSLQISDASLADRAEEIQNKKTTLEKIVKRIANIEKQDSLQHIAAMPAEERDAFIKALVKKLRKEQGVKGEDQASGGVITPFNNNKNEPANLFPKEADNDWYFYNNANKSKGFNEFKAKWGDRQNVDNWRRKSAINRAQNINNTNTDTVVNNLSTPTGNDNEVLKDEPDELSFDGLMKTIPLTPEKMDSSNKKIATNLFALAKLYQDELQDYEQAIATYEEYLRRFPLLLRDGEVYLNLFYCYSKIGNMAKAGSYKNLLNTKFASGKYTVMANNPLTLNAKYQDPVITKKYEGIYNLFIEGSFAEALSQKRKADSVYGTNYWSPQLLYIESVYYIRQRSDSVAIATLNNLISLYPQSVMVEKAQTMIDVLKRRSEIEAYLTQLDIKRADEDKMLFEDENGVVKQKPVVIQTVVKPQVSNVKPVTPSPVLPTPKDTVVAVAPTPIPVDSIKTLPVTPTPLPTIDTVKTIPTLPPTDTIKKAAPALTNGVFVMAPEAPHNVIMLLDKVDPVYITEAKNAITRYNRESYRDKKIEIGRDALDANRTILIFTGFANGEEALEYYVNLKRAAPREIGWLPVNKYSLLIITNENLQLLKNNKDVNGYRDLLNKQYSNQF